MAISVREAPLDQFPKREGNPDRIGVAFFFVSFQSIISGLTAPSERHRSRTDTCIFHHKWAGCKAPTPFFLHE
jgi:hypothetical protein